MRAAQVAASALRQIHDAATIAGSFEVILLPVCRPRKPAEGRLSMRALCPRCLHSVLHSMTKLAPADWQVHRCNGVIWQLGATF